MEADTAGSDEGTDDWMKMGSWGTAGSGCRAEDDGRDGGNGAGVAGAVTARRTVGWMGMGHGEDK